MYEYLLTFDQTSRSLSASKDPYIATSGDVETASLTVAGLGDRFTDWRAWAVFNIPFDGPEGRYFPVVPLAGVESRTAIVPAEVLMATANEELPIRIKLTEGDKVLYSANAVVLNVPFVPNDALLEASQYTTSIMFDGDSITWSSTLSYEAGALVEKDGVLYISTDGNNMGNDPEEPNTSYWIVASGSGGGSNEPHPAVYRVIGDGNTVYDVNHGYDTLDVLHTAREVATGRFLTYEAAAPQVGVLRLTFPTSLTADSVAVTITPARYEKSTYQQGAKHQLFTNVTEVTVMHNFGHIPNVDVYDEIGMMMVGQVKVDEQKAIISFKKPKSGKVVVR